MNTVKSTFSIKDLESFGGIKAHTIRMWERRYNLLEPERTPTNIRTYSLEDLQKLLNVPSYWITILKFRRLQKTRVMKSLL